MRVRLVICLAALAACHSSGPQAGTAPSSSSSHYLFAWAGDASRSESDFLAVIDVDPSSPTWASVVATQPVGAIATRPHHTDYDMPANGILWANGFDSSRTFRFDLRDPLHPRLLETPGGPTMFAQPHSYARLANGHVLGTFQHGAGDHMSTGGIVELDSSGRVLRTAPATSAVDSGIRPYSLAVVPSLNRVVTTSSDMHLMTSSRAVQIWRLSDLALLQTILLPPGPLGDENFMTAEPRVLADGRTVMVNTFHCGLYLLRGLDSDSASAQWAYSSPWREQQPFCAVPAVAGHFWLQANGPEHAVVALDVSDPAHPREVGRITLAQDEIPHWIALEPNHRRLVITGNQGLMTRILMARFDPATGALSLDSTFTTPGATRPGVELNREQWPHGNTGRAVPHGAVFSRE